MAFLMTSTSAQGSQSIWGWLPAV
jgi:hypothetical protein